MSIDIKFKFETPTLPKVPSTIQIYKTIKPTIEHLRKQIADLGKLFGLKRGLKSIVNTEEGFSVEEGPHILECFKESGSIWYGQMLELWEEKQEPIDYKKAFGVKDKIEAKKYAERNAEEFLTRNNLIPREAHFLSIEELEFAQLKEGEKDFGAPTVSGLQANFGFKLDEIPVVGPGAKISVNFGWSGKIVGFFKAWREIEKSQKVSLMSPEEALERFQKSRIFADMKEDSTVIIEKFILAYYALPAPEVQDFLLPVYVFEGMVETPQFKHDFIRYGPAVSPEVLKKTGLLETPEVFPDPDLL